MVDCRQPALLPYIRHALTEERVAQHFAHVFEVMGIFLLDFPSISRWGSSLCLSLILVRLISSFIPSILYIWRWGEAYLFAYLLFQTFHTYWGEAHLLACLQFPAFHTYWGEAHLLACLQFPAFHTFLVRLIVLLISYSQHSHILWWGLRLISLHISYFQHFAHVEVRLISLLSRIPSISYILRWGSSLGLSPISSISYMLW